MNVYQIAFDATRITVRAKSKEEAFEIVKAKDSNFKKVDNRYEYHFDEDYNEKIHFEQVPEIPGIIQWESH